MAANKVKCAVCKRMIDSRGFWKHKQSHERQRVGAMSGSADVHSKQSSPVGLIALLSALSTQVREINQTIQAIEERIGFSL